MSYEKDQKAVQDGEDVLNFLNHIAWQDILRPRLEDECDKYRHLLSKIVLNKSLQSQLTPEQVAARIEGITWVIHTIEDYVTSGQEAFDRLNASV